MKKDIKRALYQVGTLSVSYSTGAVFKNSGNSPSVTENANGMSIQDINRYTVPSVRPYGFTSVPNDNTLQVSGHLGASANNLVVLGHLMVLSNHILGSGPAPGESAMYSNGVAFTCHNTSMKYLYNSSLTATPISGEWCNKIFVDIITYLQNSVQQFMTQMVSVYNSHTHPVYSDPSITGAPNQQVSPSTVPSSFPASLITDLQAAQGGTTLITASGNSPQLNLDL